MFIEHFAGCGMMTKTIRSEGAPGARLDLDYNRGMDILTPGGFANLSIAIIMVPHRNGK